MRGSTSRRGSTGRSSSSRSARSRTAGTAWPGPPDGRVVFVRHALPGERVRAVVTEERKGFLRADAVEVLTPSPDRVEPPCPWAGPGPLRRLRLPARDAGGPAGAEGGRGPGAAGPARRAQRGRGGGARDRGPRRCPAPRTGWAGGPGFSTQWTLPGGPVCSSTARTRWCRSTRCRIAHPAVRDGAGAGADLGRPGRRRGRRRRRPARSTVLGSRATAGGRADAGRPARPGSTSGRSGGTGACRPRRSGRCTRPRPTPSPRPWSSCSRRGRPSGPGTCTAAPGCSRPRSPRP